MSEQTPQLDQADYIMDAAQSLRERHDGFVSAREHSLGEAERLYAENDELTKQLGERVLGLDGVSSPELTDTEIRQSRDKLWNNKEKAQEARRDAEDADLRRKASLWDAREHYQANQETYVEAAKKEATAAGHDIVDKDERVRRSFGSPM